MSGQQVPQTNSRYPPGAIVTRIPVYANAFPRQVLAKVKQPSFKPQPLGTELELLPPTLSKVKRSERMFDCLFVVSFFFLSIFFFLFSLYLFPSILTLSPYPTPHSTPHTRHPTPHTKP